MGLKAGQSAGDYMSREDWLALGKEGALVAVQLKGWTTTTVKESGKELDTAIIDVYVLSGKRKGDVLPGEQVFGKGLVTPLRRESVGEEVCYQINVGKNGDTKYAKADAPPEDAMSDAIEFYDELIAGQAADKPAKTPAKKTAGKTTAAKKKPEPVEEADDDEPEDEPEDDDPEF